MLNQIDTIFHLNWGFLTPYWLLTKWMCIFRAALLIINGIVLGTRMGCGWDMGMMLILWHFVYITNKKPRAQERSKNIRKSSIFCTILIKSQSGITLWWFFLRGFFSAYNRNFPLLALQLIYSHWLCRMQNSTQSSVSLSVSLGQQQVR